MRWISIVLLLVTATSVISAEFEEPLSRKELLREWVVHAERQARVKALYREYARAAQSDGPPKILSAGSAQVRRGRVSANIGRYRLEQVPKSIAGRKAQYDALIEREAQRQNLAPEIVHAVIRAESAYRATAISHAGAAGLMQLMPATARRFGVRNRVDAEQNVRGGTQYLRWLLDRFDGDLRLALAGYNAGEGAVEKHGNRVPPYRETRDYVRKIYDYLGLNAGNS